MRIGDFGQPRLERLLDDMLARERLGGALLLDGPVGVGKEALAIEMGRLLNCEAEGRCASRPHFQRPAIAAGKQPESAAERCNSCRKFDRLQHPDLNLFFPVPSGYWEDEIGEIQKILAQKAQDPYHKPEFDRPAGIQAEVLRDNVLPVVSRRPVEARFKVVILSDADQMAPGMGNLVLKTLEEPPADCLLLLTSAVPERLLPTIRSRCQRLRSSPLAAEWIETRLRSWHDAPPAAARLAASLAQGSMLSAVRFLGGDFQEARDRAFDILATAGACDLKRLMELSESVAREAAKRRHMPAVILRLMALVARDAVLVAEGAANGGTGGRAVSLVNADRAAEVHALAAAYSEEALGAVIRAAETAERQIAGHAHAELTFSALFLDLAGQSVKGRSPTGGRASPARRA